MSKTRAKTQPMPILNASLPAQFRQFRLALAREPGHPEGDAEVAYIIVAPLDSEDRIDARLWQTHRDACRVVRQRPGLTCWTCRATRSPSPAHGSTERASWPQAWSPGSPARRRLGFSL